jgi:FixJ family two-component response regulator
MRIVRDLSMDGTLVRHVDARQHNGTVFIVDDDDAVRDSLKALLEAAGLQACLFDSAEGFLAAFSGRRDGCLVLDIRLPGLDGFGVIDALHGSGASIPVILVTGHQHLARQARERQVDAVAILEKPVAAEVLLATITDAFRSKRDPLTAAKTNEMSSPGTHGSRSGQCANRME